jgi:hypothetical protein
MFRWKEKHTTYGNGAGGRIPIPKDAHVVTNLDSPMQPQTTFWIEDGDGEQLWLDTDQFRIDFARV